MTIPNIVAIKDATGDLERGASLIKRVGDNMVVLSGDDPTAVELIKLGGVGNISVTSNVAPKQMADIFRLALDGKFDEANAINDTIKHLHTELFCEASPQPTKYALHKMGMIGTGIRLPLVWLSDENQPRIDNALQKANLL